MRLARSLKAAQEASEYVDRRAAWDSWFTRHAATVVQATADEARALGWDRNFAYRDITRVPVGPLSPGNLKRAKKGLQAWLYGRLLRRDFFDTEDRLRRRTARWKLAGIPRHAATRQARNLGRLRRAVPPRIQAAMLSTLFNRWTTDTRMRTLRAGATNRCLMGCDCPRSDNIEHYVRCKHFHQWLRKRLAITPPSTDSLDEWMLATALSKLRLQQLSVGIFCAYRLINHLRHTTRTTDTTYHHKFMNQVYVEALRDAKPLRKALQRHRISAFAGRKRAVPPTTSAEGRG